MTVTTIREQISIFGIFPFSTTPQLTSELMQLFLPYELMPMVVQQVEPSGILTNRILLTKGNRINVVFGPERVDIIQFGSNSNPVPPVNLLETAQQWFPLLGRYNPQVNRVAMVAEKMYESISAERYLNFKRALLPAALDECNEWVSHWVQRDPNDGSRQEPMTVISDVARVSGTITLPVDGTRPVFGMRLTSDISTLHENLSTRFNVADLTGILSQLNQRNEEHLTALVAFGGQ